MSQDILIAHNIILIEIFYRELHLQIKLIELQTLLAQTQHEPRLKGPFPVESACDPVYGLGGRSEEMGAGNSRRIHTSSPSREDAAELART